MYEIESVSISGKKYTKDEFTINSAKNHIEIFDNTRRESGITVFKVEEVKVNIDEKIYKVKENFDFTLKLHVRGSRPSVIIDDHIEDFDSHQIDLYVEDRSSTIDFENDGIFVEVYEDDLLVSKIPLQLYDNIVEINDLKIDNYYTFKVKAIFNLFDEDGIKEEILHEGNFKTKAPLKINVLEEDETFIEFDYENLYDVNILEIALFKDNNKISSISSNEYIFDGLTKGTDYELRIKYEYNSNGDKLIGTQVKDIKTFELVYTNLIRDGREVRHPNGTIVQIPTYKRRNEEVRGIWISTVSNIDIATMQGSNIQGYKDSITMMLDNIKEAKFNTVFFQIRPMNDAFYPSELAPWSRYVTGREGKDPGFDVLKFAIQEAHKRGLELHGWLNPYRVATSESMFDNLTSENFAKKNPDLVLKDSKGAHILDPGKLEVQTYIRDVIKEIINNYPNINGIHFDDYFYLSTFGENSQSPDYDTYVSNRTSSSQSIADFRRMSVTNMIEGIYDDVMNFNNKNNKMIKFGISPSGIWANKGTHPEGSDTRGYQHYSALYADTKHWIEEGIIHYIIPQIYWEFTMSVAPYAHLVDWWSDVVKGTDVDLMIGMGLYRYRDAPWPTLEIVDQLKYNQMHDEVKGAVFFTYQDIVRSNPEKLKIAMDHIKNNLWTKDAELPWDSNLE